jgi:hypothetical protein
MTIPIYIKYTAPIHFIILNKPSDANKIAPKPAIETAACKNVIDRLPNADAIVLFAPYFMPWVKANSILGPGIIEAIKIVIEYTRKNFKDI